MTTKQTTVDGRAGNARPAYVPPMIKVMDEDEVLKTFQLTSAMSGWWLPGGPAST